MGWNQAQLARGATIEVDLGQRQIKSRHYLFFVDRWTKGWAMPHKQVLFRSAAREKILRGATQLADSIRVTLGPRSKAVLIERKWGAPIVCNDGVTIAKEFDLKDPDENLVLISDRKIGVLKDLLPLLDEVVNHRGLCSSSPRTSKGRRSRL